MIVTPSDTPVQDVRPAVYGIFTMMGSEVFGTEVDVEVDFGVEVDVDVDPGRPVVTVVDGAAVVEVGSGRRLARAAAAAASTAASLSAAARTVPSAARVPPSVRT
ncbi:MAG: hypothetical protein M3066_13410, partial [Actinomycetota bacterium]|nr:hypothetical protein [Actinomycetota bacterium]